VSVTEAANTLDVHPATAQRLLMTLVGDDFARQGDKRRYYVGPALSRISGQGVSLREHMRPHLEYLYNATEETVHLGTLIGTEVHHPDCIEATQLLRFGSRVGVRVPAHATSEGKSMLAELPWAEVESRYRVAMSGRTERTPQVDLSSLREQLALTRDQGYATNFEESEPGIAAFAISLGRIEGEHCSLSIAMPIARYTEDHRESFVRHLLAVRGKVMESLGS